MAMLTITARALMLLWWRAWCGRSRSGGCCARRSRAWSSRCAWLAVGGCAAVASNGKTARSHWPRTLERTSFEVRCMIIVGFCVAAKSPEPAVHRGRQCGHRRVLQLERRRRSRQSLSRRSRKQVVREPRGAGGDASARCERSPPGVGGAVTAVPPRKAKAAGGTARAGVFVGRRRHRSAGQARLFFGRLERDHESLNAIPLCFVKGIAPPSAAHDLDLSPCRHRRPPSRRAKSPRRRLCRQTLCRTSPLRRRWV